MIQKKKKWKIGLAAGVAVLFCMVLGCGVYLGSYYHADMDTVEIYEREGQVGYQELMDGTHVWEPEDATKGLIFYPGGKVEHKAYIPLMQECADQGILCVLVEMPFRLAVLDMKAAEGIPDQYPEIEEWYIGGHSLGGAMAASYLRDHTDDYEGLVLLGAYSTADLSNKDLSVLSVFGSEDRVMNREKYAANKSNLPEDYVEYVIEGGCHAYFGVYGAQKGDGTPAISVEEQIRETAGVISNMIQSPVRKGVK